MPEIFKKHYVLDASILLYDPDCINSYPDAHVIIPISVIEEIDHFKKDFTETGRNARIVSKMLDKIRTKGSLTDGIELENGSLLSVFVVEEKAVSLPAFINLNKSSNRVLVATTLIHQKYPDTTCLVTNDINLRVRVSAIGINVMPYEEKLPNLEKFYEGLVTLELNESDFYKLGTEGGLKRKPSEFHANQSLCAVNGGTDQNLLCRYVAAEEKLIPIKLFPEGVWGIKARNAEQEIALDLLMDPSIDIVILAGKAGTGKTLLALAVH